MKKSLVFCFLVVITHFIIAQSLFSISGIVQDSSNQRPLVFVTVALFQAKDTARNAVPINGALTDDFGRFEFSKLAEGEYRIEIAMLGYGSRKMDSLRLNGKNLTLGKILMSERDEKTDAVVITALRPIVETKDDKIIYNVESDPMAQAGNGLEVLKKVPYVTVTADDKIMVKGETSFKVLLNGKNTGIISRNPSEALRSFPANAIKKIEIITQPGAKYDAEGATAVINIITKTAVSGMSGGIYSSVNTFGQGYGGGYLNIKQNKFGISSYFGGSRWKQPTTNSESTRKSLLPENQYTQYSERVTQSDNIGGYSNVELAYDIDSLKSVSVYGSFYPRTDNSNSLSHFQQVNDSSVLQRMINGDYTQNGKDMGGSVGGDYIQKFGDKESEHEWTISTLYDRGNSNSNYQSNQNINPPST